MWNDGAAHFNSLILARLMSILVDLIIVRVELFDGRIFLEMLTWLVLENTTIDTFKKFTIESCLDYVAFKSLQGSFRLGRAL